MPEEEQKILRVEIDGKWTSDEFSDSLRSIGDIYGLRAILAIEQQSREEEEKSLERRLRRRALRRRTAAYRRHDIIFPAFDLLINPSNPTEALRFLEPGERLYVTRIQFASPGFTDLAGLGTIVGHVKDFLIWLIDLCTKRRQRELENEKRKLENQQIELENEKKSLENVRAYVSVARELGYTNTDMRLIVSSISDRQAKLIPLIQQGKIRGVQVLNSRRGRESLGPSQRFSPRLFPSI